uniref:(northern house mosquito) hypothetical protein n=1 Tax=Culex pipiens TaxID=7175 RepID=A0A8D8KYG3_CULPI
MFCASENFRPVGNSVLNESFLKSFSIPESPLSCRTMLLSCRFRVKFCTSLRSTEPSRSNVVLVVLMSFTFLLGYLNRSTNSSAYGLPSRLITVLVTNVSTY